MMRHLRSLFYLGVALLVLVGLVELAGPVQIAHATSGSWSPTGSMNMARVFHRATLLRNGQVLVAGGDNGSCGLGCFLASAELYTP